MPMLRFLRQYTHLFSRILRRAWPHPAVWLCCLVSLAIGFSGLPAKAQDSLKQREDQVIQEFSLPEAPSAPPVYQPAPAPAAPEPDFVPAPPEPDFVPAPPAAEAPPPRRPPAAPASPAPARSEPADRPAAATPETESPPTPAGPISKYVLEFNRSPIVGNRLRLQGVYPETRLGFTKPLNWKVTGAKAIVRFQHSPSLLADRSNLTLRINDTSVGSVPLNRPQSQVAQVAFNIPPNLIQDYNDIAILAEQQTREDCTNPNEPTLWTEVLPDSKIILDYQPQAIPLNFSRYPYPFIDTQSLDANQLTYLKPKAYSAAWLTAMSRFQTTAGRLVDFRPLNTRVIGEISQVRTNDRLIVIGTPAEQPALSEFTLPFPIRNGKVLDGKNQPLPGDVGVLMLTTSGDNGVPVLVATGNQPEGVAKAVQFLMQARDSQIGTGQALTVNSLTEVPSPGARDWKGFLPTANEFKLSDLTQENQQPFTDVTVRGAKAPPIVIPFRALPDDRFFRGSTLNLRYSYSAQVDPRVSAVEVRVDGNTVGSKRLTSAQGGSETFTVGLPENLLTPESRLDVQFLLRPREAATCGLATDQQLFGTVHADSGFNLQRENVVQVPDLRLLKVGFPFTAPQDLSAAAIVLPSNPRDEDVRTLIAFSERMGRLSRADSVKQTVYLGNDSLPPEARQQKQLVGIGTRDRFPLPEVFEAGSGFDLRQQLTRQLGQSTVQTLPDTEGVIKAVVSPENKAQTLLALTGQSDQGLKDVQDVFRQDSLFSQLQGDTVLVSRNQQSPSAFDPNAYNLEFLTQARQQRIENTDALNRLQLFLQDNWFVIPTAMVVLALLLYSFSQIYLNRVAKSGGMK